MNSVPKNIYYFTVEHTAGIQRHMTINSELPMVTILSEIGKGNIEPEVHDLPNDMVTFLFPSGRVWYRNGNRFVAQRPAVFQGYRSLYNRQPAKKKES